MCGGIGHHGVLFEGRGLFQGRCVIVVRLSWDCIDKQLIDVSAGVERALLAYNPSTIALGTWIQPAAHNQTWLIPDDLK